MTVPEVFVPDVSSLDALIARAVSGELGEDEIQAFCAAEGPTRHDLYNRLATTIARRFLADEMSYEDGDAALNTIFALMVTDLSEGPELPEPAYAIYEAFDLGEYHHGDGLDPVEGHTVPMLRDILESSAAPTLILMVGLPGAGKTTLAKRLEQERPALRLTPDEWMTRLSIDGYDEGARAEVEAIQWEVAARALSLGLDVILDFGFWSREERDEYRARAASVGAVTELRYLDVPRDELLRRLEPHGTGEAPHTFPVSARDLDTWLRAFQPPDPDELGDPT